MWRVSPGTQTWTCQHPVYSLVPSSILTSSPNAFVRNVLAQVLCHDAAANQPSETSLTYMRVRTSSWISDFCSSFYCHTFPFLTWTCPLKSMRIQGLSDYSRSFRNGNAWLPNARDSWTPFVPLMLSSISRSFEEVMKHSM